MEEQIRFTDILNEDNECRHTNLDPEYFFGVEELAETDGETFFTAYDHKGNEYFFKGYYL